MFVDSQSPSAGRLKKLLMIAAMVLLPGIVFIIRSRPGDDSQFHSKSVGFLDKKAAAGSVRHEKSQTAGHSFRQGETAAPAEEKKAGPSVWNQPIVERGNKYEVRFSMDDSVGPGRKERNSKQVRFWIDLLGSKNPEMVQKAIGIIEASTWETAGVVRNSKGAKAGERDLYTRDEWESNQIFNTLLRARVLVSLARNGVPLKESAKSGDADDSLILKDVSLLRKVFVPRLRDPDPAKAAAAKSVINFFTFDIFRDEHLEWWEAGCPLDNVK